MVTTTKERIMLFIKHLGIGQRKFELKIGVSNGYINNLKESPSAKTIQKIICNYPQLSQTWLLTGEGEMLNNNDGSEVLPQESKPHLPIAVIAGRVGGISEAVRLHECEQLPVIHAFPTYDFTLTVQGDSMEPKFEGGDRIAIRKATNYVEWGKTYVVDTDDGAILKRIYDDGEAIRCVSFNPDYPDFHINKHNIYGLYKVVGLIRINQ